MFLFLMKMLCGKGDGGVGKFLFKFPFLHFVLAGRILLGAALISESAEIFVFFARTRCNILIFFRSGER